MKKMPGDIILHKWIKNYNHMLYCSWDMAHDRCDCYFSFWAIFCPFIPLTAQKIKMKKKWKKKASRYHYFTYVYQKLWSDDVRFLRYGVQWTDRQIDEQIDEWTERVTYRSGCLTWKRFGMGSILREEKGQWWDKILCIINCKCSIWTNCAVKSLTSFLTSFLRCHKDVTNLPR